MTQRVTWRPAAVAALLLAAAAAEAGVQGRYTVGWLGLGAWQLREGEGQAFLVKSPYVQPVVEDNAVRPRPGKSHRWEVSSPTIKADSGRLLGYATKGREPSVRMVGKGEEGASTRWSFEIVAHVIPRGGSYWYGDGGIRFRAMAAQGPYKGWYLAAKADGEGKLKRLVLVRAKKEATVFKYIEEYYYVRP
jgi:hypothetical protein